MRAINELLKQRRIELGLTLLDVAKAVGVSEGTVSRWESGDIENMRRDKIAALATVLDISPGVIMGWEPKPVSGKKLSESEKQILEIYSNLSDEGKQYIIQQMKMALQVYPKTDNKSPFTDDLQHEIKLSINNQVKHKL